MGAEKDILDFLGQKPEGASISDIAQKTNHTRATSAKYLELMRFQDKVSYREVGKAKLWISKQKKKKILIAEDEANIRKLIQVILQHEDHFFIEAKDGAEALEKVSEQMPDIIILDLMMPKIDGIEVCRQLKKNALTRKIPVIMLTAKKQMSDKTLGISVGADDYLTKPFEPRELRVRVKTFLEKENKERNAITNLPTFDYISNKIRNLDNHSSVFYIYFKNLQVYRRFYGFSKTNELIRLTSQIITHNLENSGVKNFAGHDTDDNFIIGAESSKVLSILHEIENEFKSTIPFFYDVDYENIDMKKNIITQVDEKGAVDKIPIIELKAKELKKEDFSNLQETLKSIFSEK